MEPLICINMISVRLVKVSEKSLNRTALWFDGPSGNAKVYFLAALSMSG